MQLTLRLKTLIKNLTYFHLETLNSGVYYGKLGQVYN